MDLTHIWKGAMQWVHHNQPMVLTGIAVGGVITTTLLGIEAGRNVGHQESTQGIAQDPKQRFLETWHHYAPPTIAAILTCVAIVAAHRVSARRHAAVAAAFALSEKTLVDYREEVKNAFGERKSEAVDAAVKQRNLDDIVERNVEIVPAGNGTTRCYDAFSGRLFWSSRLEIDAAVNKLNQQLVNNLYASVNDFYSFLGLSPTTMGEDLGWTADRLLEVSFTSLLDDGGEPVLGVYYQVQPFPHYYKQG